MTGESNDRPVDRSRAALRMLQLALLLFAALLTAQAHAWFWNAPSWADIDESIARDHPGLPSIEIAQLRDWLNDPARPRPLLVDARSREEYDVSHLPGAVHAESVDALRSRLTQHDGPVVVYCSVGVRSARLAKDLLASGVTKVSNLRGSIFAWANHGWPLERAGGPTAQVHPFNRRWGTLLDQSHWSHEP